MTILTETYAQHAEDVVIIGLLRALLPERFPSHYHYLDIGANHPIANSNTYGLYRRGCNGVLVEPNPALRPLLQMVRPRDQVLSVGVTAGPTSTARYTVTTNSQLNTFDPAFIAHWNARLPHLAVEITDVLDVPIVNINDLIGSIISDYGWTPDLLSIDVEGLDIEISEAITFDAFRPALVVVEISPAYHQDARHRIGQIFSAAHYRLIHSGPVNDILVRRDLL